MPENNIGSEQYSHVPDKQTVTCAIYARCASGRPQDSNAAEQIRVCAEYAEKRGWKVAAEFVQTDIGASGVALTGCTSLIRLLKAAQQRSHQFDCVLVADISRLGRNLDRVTRLVGAFRARGVFVQAVHGNSQMLHSAALDEEYINCIRQYLRSAGRQCPMCGKEQRQPNLLIRGK